MKEEEKKVDVWRAWADSLHEYVLTGKSILGSAVSMDSLILLIERLEKFFMGNHLLSYVVA